MKEYKYTINGTKYEVAVGDIEENIVTVTVNGEEYQVEMELPAEPEKKKPVLGKPAEAYKFAVLDFEKSDAFRVSADNADAADRDSDSLTV